MKVAVLMLCLAPALLGQAKKLPPPAPQPPQAEIAPSPLPVGRYVAIQPQRDSNNGYPNFLWVLDTVTGSVTAYRISSVTDGGKHLGWTVDQLETPGEIYRRRMAEPQ